MDKMTNSRAAEVLDRLALGADEPDVHAALAHAIAQLREPAEAQAQGGGEVYGYEHDGRYWSRDGATPWVIHHAVPLYTAPPSAPAGVDRLHPETADLVHRFAQAVAEKLAAAERKYGWSTDWKSPDWMDQCREQLVSHVAKGDPRDVAAYAAFLWHHGEPTALAQQPAAVDGAATNSAVSAIQFALKDPEGMTFLRLWNEGEFDTLRREWPDAPVEVYIDADPLAAQPGGSDND